jgi:adenylate kinase family enzyme
MADCRVIDGNYSQLLPQRLARATGFIFLDICTPLSLCRYIQRSLARRGPIGALEGGKDSVKWDVLKHIVITTPRNQKRYAELQETIALLARTAFLEMNLEGHPPSIRRGHWPVSAS